jgi:hypothetical protein
MNAPRQAVHILAKDIRGHALEIAFVLALSLIFALTFTVTWAEVQDPYFRTPVLGEAAQILLIVASGALIGRVVQSDGVAGKASYWLTRPLSRPALLASKLAFVLLFVHAPIFASQLAIVTGSGLPVSLPPLLATHAVVAAAGTLPLITLATLTTTFSRFVLGGVVVVPLALLTYVAPNSSFTFLGTTVLAILALIACTALAIQYRRRSTLRVATWSLVALSIVALSMLGLETLPSARRLVARATVAAFPPPTVASTIRLGDASERGEFRYSPPFVSLPIDTEITSDMSIRRYEVEVLAADGRVVGLVGTGGRLRFTAENDIWLDLQLAPADYDALEDSLISVRLVIDLMTFESRETEPIPLDGSFAIVDGRTQCGLGNPYQIVCRTAFGSAAWQLDDSNTEAQLTWLPMRSFGLNPIQTRQFGRRSSGPLASWPGPSIATVLREPVSHTRQGVTFENIRLGDWAP